MKTKMPYRYTKEIRGKLQNGLAPITWEALQKLAAKQPAKKMAFEVTEGANFFELNISIPGCRRNDFNILVKGRMLHLKVRCAYTPEQSLNGLKQILNRPILLPGNLDPDFISAEYKNGTLTIYFFKTSCRCDNMVEQIFVY